MIVLSKHVKKNKRHVLQAVQVAHANPVPRMGGITIVCALVLSLSFQFGDAHQVNLSSKLLLSNVLIFFIEQSEDLGELTSPWIRILTEGQSIYILLGAVHPNEKPWQSTDGGADRGAIRRLFGRG